MRLTGIVKLDASRKEDIKSTGHKQVLPTWLVLRRCFVAPYVPLPTLGSASVPAMTCRFLYLSDKPEVSQSRQIKGEKL